ncbi:hypothetical protein K435DRAFT_299185 [Dendrothele bispora CBS 962.96]|uniref:Uncharacterized protein n=1 Tax=Dendrothele bispora (strain CBS 962.96) TaxID=1314807 RepID=A0A4S8MKA6_DENBC|nr:hypothetical protein K435DRAFT_299185 [Dendrothele bispora CBS 962.96]
MTRRLEFPSVSAIIQKLSMGFLFYWSPLAVLVEQQPYLVPMILQRHAEHNVLHVAAHTMSTTALHHPPLSQRPALPILPTLIFRLGLPQTRNELLIKKRPMTDACKVLLVRREKDSSAKLQVHLSVLCEEFPLPSQYVPHVVLLPRRIVLHLVVLHHLLVLQTDP